MASRGAVPEGTDGSDHKHRQTIVSRYAMIARAQGWMSGLLLGQAVLAATRFGVARQGLLDGADSPLLLEVPAGCLLLLALIERSGTLARNSTGALWAFAALNAAQALGLLFAGVLAPKPADASSDAERVWNLSAALATLWAVLAAAGAAVSHRVIRAVGAGRARPKKRQ